DLPRLLLQGSSSTLQQLRILGCRNLSVLPKFVSFNGGNRPPHHATIGCPELSKRYRENGGEDWHTIAHIQKVVIKD
ncbi:hypothetical protein Gotur_025485, partial [Gossypium turneri]